MRSHGCPCRGSCPLPTIAFSACRLPQLARLRITSFPPPSARIWVLPLIHAIARFRLTAPASADLPSGTGITWQTDESDALHPPCIPVNLRPSAPSADPPLHPQMAQMDADVPSDEATGGHAGMASHPPPSHSGTPPAATRRGEQRRRLPDRPSSSTGDTRGMGRKDWTNAPSRSTSPHDSPFNASSSPSMPKSSGSRDGSSGLKEKRFSFSNPSSAFKQNISGLSVRCTCLSRTRLPSSPWSPPLSQGSPA